MKVKIRIILPALAILILACNREGENKIRNGESDVSLLSSLFAPVQEKAQELHPEEYISFVENKENGFIAEKAFDDLSFSAFAQPEEYVAVKRLDPLNVTEKGFLAELENVKGYQYFIFSVHLPEKVDLLSYKTDNNNQFHDRLQFYSFRFHEHVFLIDGADTLACRLSHFERNHGMSSVHNFLLVFEKPSGKGEKTLIIEDPFLGFGQLKFHFEKNIFNRKTELIFS